MKLRFLKAKHWLLLALMGLMGVSSCTKDMYGSPELMYGGPETGYNDTLPNK